MAQRRMFSLKVVDTDSFLDMSPTAQLLYFHLGMRADDDGFVSNPKRIQRMLGVPDDDVTVLATKGFIIPMATSGVCVITHWPMNNLIKSDRHNPTIYQEEFTRLKIEHGTYIIDFGFQNGSKMVPLLEPQVRLGKDRLNITPISPLLHDITSDNDDSAVAVASATLTPNSEKWFTLWHSLMGFPITRRIGENQKSLNGLVKEYGKDSVKQSLEALAYAKKQPKKKQPFFVQYTTSFMKVRDNWDNIQSFMTSEVTETHLTRELIAS